MKRIEFSGILGKALTRGGAVLACVAVVALVVGSLATCGQETALLLTVSSTRKVDSFDLLVKNLATNKIVLKRTDETVDPENAGRDISKPGQELRVAVEFSAPGNYLIYVLGKGSANTSTDQYYQFFINDFEINEVRSESIVLVPVTNDADKDLFPACGTKGINCAAMSCKFLDCDDNNKSINPFAKEVCGNGKDDDCSAGCNAVKGAGDETCQDADGDGVAAGEDCDDNDPCKSPKIREAKNMCDPKQKGRKLPGTLFTLPGACKKKGTPPFCGDGVDQDCNGQDAPCFKDNDCDDYSPPADCNDNDPKINPGVKENCNNNIDDNCNKVINEGCIPCDVDGDNFAATTNKSAACKLPKTDPDDYDAGVHPETTKTTSNAEGGSTLTALREFCSYKVGKDGKKHREVDHDGDKLAASLDGCPSSNCDADGDGFQNISCSPPISKRDCDDNDAQTFPDAPDKCGDGKAQNCSSDYKCADITDKDNDGYSPPADCNDSNSKIHPWAKELCDGVDNDCDGLTDEGNPSATGKPIDTKRALCTDDNDGQCFPLCSGAGKDCVDGIKYKKPNAQTGQLFKLSGVCACSKHSPTNIQETTRRVKCEGETNAVVNSLRCFGAIPSTTPEECDKLDHDCNGKPDAKVVDSKDAKNLRDYGKACSVNQGTCVAGTVSACDLAKTVANSGLVTSVLANVHNQKFNVHWICKGAQLPVNEYCNGKDDDCNKVIPEKEKDKDGDLFIECSVSKGDTCKKGKGRFDLNTKYSGCGDCNDKAKQGGASIYPKAKEFCNAVDDNCSKDFPNNVDPTGLGDDGVNECPPKGQVCCTGQKSCFDINTSFLNCSGCGKACPWKISDQCVKRVCKCAGSTACTGGTNCKDKECKCITGKDSMCNGCCDGKKCLAYAQQTPKKCGSKKKCGSCDDKNDCTKDECVGKGTCKNTTRPYLYGCKDKYGTPGKCIGKSCCTGCISGGTCKGGAHVDKCGKGGETCQICYTSNICQERTCPKGACVYPNSSTSKKCPDTKYCTVGEHCSAGKCVWSKRNCPGDQCNTGDCANVGGCFKVPVTNGTTCNDNDKCTVSDKCQGGKCGGDAKNCTSYNDACNTGKCSASTGSCYKKPHTGPPFISNCDSQYCTVGDTCLAGVCKPGATRTCSHLSTNCKTGSCNFSKQACEAINKTNGTNCTTGGKPGKCTNGVCVKLDPDQGVPDQTVVPPDQATGLE